MIEIMNLRKDKPVYPYDHKVDRQTPVGNPFPMRLELDRDRVCDQYETYIQQNKHDPKIAAYLNMLYLSYKKHGKLRLFCWCAPKRCHAESIRRLIEEAWNV